MSEPLRVLFVEDSKDDVLLLVRDLRRGGYDVTYEQVSTAEAMAAALDRRCWDIVISDYSIPQFGGFAALSLLKQKGTDLPFIIVSGAIGEDVAVAAMRDGARDYIMKGNLMRLAPAVRRELKEAAGRRARRQAEEDLRQSEERLRQSQKLEAIGRLAGGVAHDFNNHLTIIMGYCQLLTERLGPAQSCTEVGIIKDAACRAASLTRQLLTFSRSQILEPSVLDLNAIVEGLSQMLRRLIGEDIELVLSLDPALGKVKADPSQVEQVLMNLVVNARDAMPNGGRLTIETANADPDKAVAYSRLPVPHGSCVRLTVADTGAGMDREVQAHIFEPFFTTKAKDKGTGLGLAMVYGIVQQSGGCISVQSEAGRGTALRIHLPRVEAAVEATKTAGTLLLDLKGSETVLVAEDDEILRRLIRKYLVDAGYSVLEASDGAEALEVRGRYKGRIDIVITDAVMPRMNGRELVRHLQSQQPDIKVLYASGYTDEAVFRDGLLAPGAAFLHKPFTRDELLRKLRAVLEPHAGVHALMETS